jgi:hypothetical protein
MDEYLAARAEPAYQQARQWCSYLEMLSVERMKPFISELGLPIKPDAFPQVVRITRACLEVFMFPTVSKRGNADDPHEFIKYWHQYRGKEGVLSDEALRNFAEPRKYLDTKGWFLYLAGDLFGSLQEPIGSDMGDALRDWFRKRYLTSWRWQELWPSAFLRLFRDYEKRVGGRTPPPLSESQQETVTEFCKRFYDERQKLEKRFERIKRRAEAGQPTTWEAVLQTFRAESSAGDYYPWLRSIESCLISQVFRARWYELKDKLGPDLTKQLVKWARQEVGRDESILI